MALKERAGEGSRSKMLQRLAFGLLLGATWNGPIFAQAAAPATGLLSSRGVVLNPQTGKVYAVDSARDAVAIFDPTTRRIARVPAGTAPVAIAVNAATNTIYVANEGAASISVIDGKSDTVAASVRVGPRPYAIAANPATNKIYVSNTFSDFITVIDGATNATSTLKAGSADAIGVDAKLGRIYLLGYENPNLILLDDTPKIMGKVSAGMHLWGLAVDEATHTVYATRSANSELAVVDEATGVVTTVPVGAIPCAAAVNPATNMIYVVNYGDDTVTVVDGAKRTAVATLRVGNRPQGIAVNSVKNLVYVANTHSNSVTIIDGKQNRVLKSLKTGNGPYALAVNPNTGELYLGLEGTPAFEVIEPARIGE